MIARLCFLGLVVLPFTLLALPLQLALRALNVPLWRLLPLAFYRLLAVGLGLRVRLEGERLAKGPVLLVANHIGWLDIVAIGAVLPVSFVAKSEVAGWPLVGPMARLQRTIFVDRRKRTDAGRTAREMRARIAEGGPVLLFAEGTSDIGTHVLPFRSALLGAARDAMGEGEGAVPVQPLAIAYTKISGLPLSRADRRTVAWIGDMGVGDNLGAILSSGPKQVVLALGAPLDGAGDRKRVARTAEAAVRSMLGALNRGHPLPKPGEVVNRAS
ncbi:lysophospholipid acyltransferase family protein [Pelagibacterium lacus]|uniref:1-acyl-sn-glycerol-3-phosphate acyltransferase n=1 Tax=Pelagibacterium lacus TaxID=2282655 RepID=A0A369W6K2_9HYPH|nr:lysophospholipid acyltransferase family protein [Pelagibacterium lacus]RDE09485.1 1-acyl-sn-glycerol-3-phosphate acyltransferase [Pelagibacterium lacus]